jgi:hypothetical protein
LWPFLFVWTYNGTGVAWQCNGKWVISGKGMNMDSVPAMRKAVKQYIDQADERVVKMVHALLQADGQSDLWDELPETVQADVDEAMGQAAQGKGTPHASVMKRYKKWTTK